MPGRKYDSIRRPRVYEALRKKGYSKERAARIANSKAAATAGFVVAPHGPGGLLSMPGLGAPKRRTKAEGDDDRSYVRSEDGKFSSTPGGGGGEAGGAEPAAEPKPEPAPTPKRLTKAPISADDAKAFLNGLGLDPKLAEALSDWISGATAEEPEDMAVNREAADALAALGLITIRPGQDEKSAVTIDLSGPGKQLLKATEGGDIAKGMQVVERAHNRNLERQSRAQARQAKRDAALAKRRAPKPAPPAKPANAPKPAKPAAPAKGGGGGGGDDDGTARRRELTELAQLLFRPKVMRPRRKRTWYETYRAARQAGHAPDAARMTAKRALRETDAKRAGQAYQRAVSRLSVFKDAAGAYRWVTRTTTAFKDRDGEILSTKALEANVARMRQTGRYGPLRYWHVGAPDATNPDAPWGPGLDLGMCDYAILIGRTQIESGTFTDPAVGRAMAAKANQYELSPGFFHAPTAPDAAGVYDHIEQFERSLIPTAMGVRAANRFTGLSVTSKESRMNPHEFQKRLKAFMADMSAAGVPRETAQGIIASAVAAEKSATAQGVAYKSTAATPPIYLLPDGTPGVIQDGQFVALKAATTKAPMPGGEMVDAGMTEAMDGMEREAEDDAEGEGEESLLSAMDIEAIAVAVVEKLMGAMGDLTAKMSTVDEELKMRGYSRMKEQSDALATRISGLEATLKAFTVAVKDLTDDLPAAGHRDSERSGADPALVAVAAKNAGVVVGPPPTMLDQIAASIPWPFDVPPPAGVNPAQHAAPGVSGA